MGRVDLSRHRKIAASDTPPLPLPNLAPLLAPLSSHPHHPLVAALRTLSTAPTQRLQLHATKLLAHHLRDAHYDAGQHHPVHLRCSCLHPQPEANAPAVAPVCAVALPVLAQLCFDARGATAGLVSTALRGLLACRAVGVPGVSDHVDVYVERVRKGVGSDMQSLYQPEAFTRAAADVAALAAVVAEPAARGWVLEEAGCVEGALSLIAAMAGLFCVVAEADRGGTEVAVGVSRTVLEGACAAAMKAAQDVVNALVQGRGKVEGVWAGKGIGEAVERARKACGRVLRVRGAPRSCAVACAVAYVSATLFGEEEVGVVLKERVMGKLVEFPSFAKLALLRGVMEAPAAQPAMAELLFPGEELAGDAEVGGGESVFEMLAALTRGSADVHFRFLAMDALIACVRRSARGGLDTRCRDVVLALVYARWQEPFPGIASQIRETMEALVASDGGGQEATAFWEKMVRTLTGSDWCTKGIYAPLNVLVKRLGASKMLQVSPECQMLALKVVGEDARLVKPVSDWLAVLWKGLVTEYGACEGSFREITSGPLLQSLVGDDRSLRERSAEHVLPAYFRAVGEKNVEAEANHLLRVLKGRGVSPADQIRGTICIMSVARKFGAFVGSFSDPELCQLLRKALRCGQQDVRSSALDLVVTCRVSTAPISQEELDLVYSYIPIALMPGSSPSDRSRFRHSMRRFFERFSTARHAARDGSSGWWMRERKEVYCGVRTEEFEQRRHLLLDRLHKFQEKVSRMLQSCIYPGAAFGRRSIALEVAVLFAKNIGFDDSLSCSNRPDSAAVYGFLACLLDEWERPRRAAMQLLSTIDGPFAALASSSKIRALQTFALPLLDSPRLKDVDAGALLCRFIFRKFVKDRSLQDARGTCSVTTQPSVIPLLFSSCVEEKDYIDLRTSALPELEYATSVLKSMEELAMEARKDLGAACKRGLFHGRCLLLRHLIQDLNWKAMTTEPSSYKAAKRFLDQMIRVYENAANVAMQGISLQYVGAEEYGKTSTSLESDAESDDEEDIMLVEKKKLVSTSCFLTMKEICLSLGILCHEVPFQIADNSHDFPSLLSKEAVIVIGEMLVHVFRNTRHWGVIDGASEGLQLLCESVLQTSSAELRVLPTLWVQETMTSLLRGELYVLRRSAGIPAMFSAVVNAEASNFSRGHDTPILNSIVCSLTDHLKRSSMFIDSVSVGGSRSREEDSIAHALNLLRSLFLNGNIASYVIKYLEIATMCCINAFSSPSWLIKNSAMMLFSALLQRGIGVSYESTSENPLQAFTLREASNVVASNSRGFKSTTAHQFFSRHPKLHPFLLQKLEVAILKSESDGDTIDPVLFPTLYLLASLSPSSTEDPTARISMHRFQAVLRRCIHWKSAYIRRTAACALVPLVDDPSHIVDVLTYHLKHGLPPEPTGLAVSEYTDPHNPRRICDEGSGERLHTLSIRQNQIHGELLAIKAILDAVVWKLTKKNRDAVISVLSENLRSLSWIARDSARNPCHVTRAAMLQILCESYALSQSSLGSHGQTQRQCTAAHKLFSLCSEIADHDKSCLVDNLTQCNPLGQSSFLTHATRLVALVCVAKLENGDKDITDALESLHNLVSSPHTEVVREGLLALQNVMASQRLEIEFPSDVESPQKSRLSSLMQTLTAKTFELMTLSMDEDVIIESIQLLDRILLFERQFRFSSIREHISSNGVEKLFQVARCNRFLAVREHALIVLGRLVSCAILDSEHEESWMSMVGFGTSASQEVSTRISSCSSLAHSGLGKLDQHRNLRVLPDMSTRGFLKLSNLLEDDNVEVRSNAMEALHKCFPSTSGYQQLVQDVLPAFLSVFELLGSRCRNSEVLFEYMSTLLMDKGGDTLDGIENILEEVWMVATDSKLESKKKAQLFAKRSIIQHDAGHLTPLFELDENDQTEDKVLQLQLVVSCYRKVLLQSQVSCSRVQMVLRLCEDAIRSLKAEVIRASSYKGMCPLEAAGFTADGFLRCYKAVLLTVLAVSCLHATMRVRGADEEQLAVAFKSSLSKIAAVAEQTLPAAIGASVRSLERSVCNTNEKDRMQEVFFLLPP